MTTAGTKKRTVTRSVANPVGVKPDQVVIIDQTEGVQRRRDILESPTE
jgi:hypothetical protein